MKVRDADKKRRLTDVNVRDTDQKVARLAIKRRDADKKRRDADKKRRDADKKRRDADKKRRLADKKRRLADVEEDPIGRVQAYTFGYERDLPIGLSFLNVGLGIQATVYGLTS